ncbi:MAG: hypothetical protein H0U10_02930, partial [Chloroflexia bacterium]|nr:hypothetical protein [Chloroflexia bacterium]
EAIRARTSKRRGRLKAEEDPYLLRGVIACGYCGLTLRSSLNSKARYYVCGCHAPSRARKLGRPGCALPDVPARHLEAEAWRVLSETLLHPGVLAAGLEAARSAHGEGGRLRRDRRDAIDAEIAKHRRTLDALADKLTDTSGGEFFDAIVRRAKECEAIIAKLNADRAQLAATPSEGMSDAEVDSIIRFAETARRGMEAATPHDRRVLYETVRLRARVSSDHEGVQLGRRNRFRIDWEARIPLLDSASRLLKRDDA